MAIIHGFSNTVPDGTATSVVRPSDWNSAHHQYYTLSGNTLGAPAVSGTNVIFQGSGNISLSGTSNTIIFYATGGGGGGGAAISAGSQSNSSGTVVFSNSNGVTFGMSNSSVITASVSQSVQTQASGNIAGSGFTSTTTAGTAIVGTNNSNGLSLGVPAYLTTARASNDAVGLNTAGTNVTWTVSSNGISFNGSGYAGTATSGNNISLTVNSGGISASVAAPGAANYSIGVSNLGNTAGSTGITGTRIVFVGTNNISLSQSTDANGATISINQTGGAGAAVTVSDSATSGTIGRLAFTNLNGVTFSLSTGAAGSHTIVGSHNGLTSQSNQAFSASGGSSAFQTLSFSNANGLTFSNSAGQVAVTHDLLYSSASRVINIIAATNNTGGGTASLSSNVSFSNANGATFYTSAGGAVALSYSVPTVTNSSLTMQAGASTLSSVSRIAFVDGNGVSFGASTSNNGSITITATVKTDYLTTAAQSSASNISIAVAATNNTGGGAATLATSLSFSNANGLTFYTSAGNAIVGSYSMPTVPTAYVSSVNGSSGAISFATGSSLSSSQNGSTITWGLASNITTALQSAGAYLTTAALSGDTSKYVQNWKLTGNTAGTTSSAQGTDLWLSGGNNVTVSGSSNSIVFSVGNYITTARASTDAIGLNVAQSNVTWTVNSGGLTLDGRGYAGTATSGNNISLTVNSGGITASVAAPGGGAAINVSAGTTSNNLQTIVFSNSNGVSFGLNGSTVTASAAGGAAESNWVNLLGANTAGNTTASGSTIGWSASNLTLSGTNGSQIVISAPAMSSLVGANGISISTAGSTLTVMNNFISSYENQPLVTAATMTLNMASISHCVAFNLPEPISASFIRIPVSMSMNSTSIATSANSNTGGVALYSTFNAVIYSLGVGGNSQSLQSVASGSAGFTFSNSISVAANGTQCSISQGYSAQAEGIAATVTTQYSVSTSQYPFSSTAFSRFSAGRFLDIPFANSLPPGPYWLVFGGSSSTNATTGAAALSVMTNCLARYSNHYGVSQGNVVFGVMNNANLTSGGFLGAGSFSTAGGGTTASLPLSAISSSASNVRPYFQMLRSA